MDIISKKKEILENSKDIRSFLNSIIDEKSFVEKCAFSFDKDGAKNEGGGSPAGGATAAGGVITGYATISDYPFYAAACNLNVMKGGFTKVNVKKICDLLTLAKNKENTPFLFILNTLGVKTDEGVPVLEEIAKMLRLLSEVSDIAPVFTVINGACFGVASLIVGLSDFTFFTPGAVLASNSPFVISAKSNKNLADKDVGGAAVHGEKTNLCKFPVSGGAEVKELIVKILKNLPDFSLEGELEGDINAGDKSNGESSSADIINAVFDGGSAVEISSAFAKEVKTVFGRIGGIACAGLAFENVAEGVELTNANTMKIKEFLELCIKFDLPLVNFVNAAGIKASLEEERSFIMKNITDIFRALDCIDNKISVVYKNAVGLGYMLFAAKESGYDYTLALSDAKIALLSDKQASMLDVQTDLFDIAKQGYVDNIISGNVKQNVFSILQMIE